MPSFYNSAMGSTEGRKVSTRITNGTLSGCLVNGYWLQIGEVWKGHLDSTATQEYPRFNRSKALTVKIENSQGTVFSEQLP